MTLDADPLLDNCDLTRVMLRDAFRLRRWRERLHKSSHADSETKNWLAAYNKSVGLAARRAETLPNPALDLSLPIAAYADAIRDALANHQVVVISGETGSGKSTQIPLIALQLGLASRGLIGHTQPRRLAARGVAARLAQQIGSPIGQHVGFKIRFTDQTGDQTLIKVMTDGILLAETQTDHYLENYELLIIDEAHERSLNIDFILGYIRRLLPKRPDLKIVITSATIDTERFANHFQDSQGNPAPIISVPGRSYPVEIVYRPGTVESADDDLETIDQVVRYCQELVSSSPGDILVFLPTENEIRLAAKKLRGARLESGGRLAEILPLYARLSTEQQNLIFAAHSHSRIVLATNVAESSITVPGIRFVIDTGTVRINRYAPRSKVQRLPIEPISQASANQRAGRCGRVAPGICIRLYSEEDYHGRPKFTTPEIRRTNLAGTILRLTALGLGRIENFPFLDPPHPESIRDGLKTLFEIGAIDESQKLTHLGKKLARLPVDPRVGRILLAAEENGCLPEILIIAAWLEVSDPRLRPAERIEAADAAHAQWNDARSDFTAILKLWDFVHKLKQDLSRNQFRKALERNCLSVSLVTQWADIHRQLLSITADERLHVGIRRNEYDAIHKSLLAGLLSSIAMQGERHEYTGADGIKFYLWPGSGLISSNPKWIVAAELVETSRRFGRTIAEINPKWIEPLAAHLINYQYVDPHWQEKSETAIVYENATLFGLPIVMRRRVGLGAIDPVLCRQLFIDEGLIEGQLRHPFAFLKHNRGLLEEIAALARKTRRRDLIIESHQLESFYASRLPPDAVDSRSLQRLIKASPSLDRRLCLTAADLGISEDASAIAEHFPERVQIGRLIVPVEYIFAPGATDDGANLSLPVEALGQIDELKTGWLIPGLLRERIEAMIRSLPKAVRRNLVPAPDVARTVSGDLNPANGSFPESVAQKLSRIAGDKISAEQFQWDKIPPHLLVNIRLVDASGKLLAQARSVRQLHEKLMPERRPLDKPITNSDWHRDGLTSWIWDDLPADVPIDRGAMRMIAYPAIVDQENAVGLRLVESADKSKSLTECGLIRLIQLANRRALRSHVAWLPGLAAAQVQLSRWLSVEQCNAILADLIIRIGCIENQPIPNSRREFESTVSRSPQNLATGAQEVAKWLPRLGEAAHRANLRLESMPVRFAPEQKEMREQIARLLAAKTLRETEWAWLQHVPRYLLAVESRAEKLFRTNAQSDQAEGKTIAEFWQRYVARAEQHERAGWVDPELTKFRWMIEELCVSLFAQQLGTSLPVSAKRLDKQWSRIR